MKLTQKVKVTNAMGLHTRPATAIVKMLQGVKSHVQFTYKTITINAKSILSILMLAARKHTVLTVTVEGIDAEQVMQKLVQGFQEGFGE